MILNLGAELWTFYLVKIGHFFKFVARYYRVVTRYIFSSLISNFSSKFWFLIPKMWQHLIPDSILIPCERPIRIPWLVTRDPGSMIPIPRLWSRSQGCDPWSHIPGYDPVIRCVPIVLNKCRKAAHWNAKKMLKYRQKSKKLLPKFLDIFISTIIKGFIFLFFAIIANIGQEKLNSLRFARKYGRSLRVPLGLTKRIKTLSNDRLITLFSIGW